MLVQTNLVLRDADIYIIHLLSFWFYILLTFVLPFLTAVKYDPFGIQNCMYINEPYICRLLFIMKEKSRAYVNGWEILGLKLSVCPSVRHKPCVLHKSWIPFNKSLMLTPQITCKLNPHDCFIFYIGLY